VATDDDGGLEFETWYSEAHPRLVGAMCWITGDVELARDAVDEACVRALSHWKRVRQMESPRGWTYQVALNVWRRTQRRSVLERKLLRRALPVDHVVAGPAGEAWELVRELSRRERTAVALRHVGDLTEAQIGEAMGIRRSTVSVLLSRAYAKLEPRLRDDFSVSESP
jgi:RNA polymerase sigma-70 factor, ECF subfamily